MITFVGTQCKILINFLFAVHKRSRVYELTTHFFNSCISKLSNYFKYRLSDLKWIRCLHSVLSSSWFCRDFKVIPKRPFYYEKCFRFVPSTIIRSSYHRNVKWSCIFVYLRLVVFGPSIRAEKVWSNTNKKCFPLIWNWRISFSMCRWACWPSESFRSVSTLNVKNCQGKLVLLT